MTEVHDRQTKVATFARSDGRGPSYATVRVHQGEITVTDEVGVGATVTVRFPAERIVCSPRDNIAVFAADKKAG